MLVDADYQRLLAFRDGIRRFLRWSEDQAAAVGLTPVHHQLLLAIRGHEARREPTIGELADHLQLQQHSIVGLVNRAERAGLVSRWSDPDDKRLVRVTLTAEGLERLERLSTAHLEELRRLSPAFRRLWVDLDRAPAAGQQ
jgi:DNA-binding MarR family transcriptional regulator